LIKYHKIRYKEEEDTTGESFYEGEVTVRNRNLGSYGLHTNNERNKEIDKQNVERRKYIKEMENRYRKLGERKEMVKQEKRKGNRRGN
jgi:hypothetical protein